MRKKINREIQDLSNTISQLKLTDIQKNPPKNTEYTFFSSAHGIFSRIQNILGYKT